MRYRLPYSLFKRGDYWYYRTYDARGIRTTAHSTGCTSKTKAILFCEELIKYNKLTGERKIKFEDYAKHFFDDDSVFVKDRAVPLTERTLSVYRVRLNHLMAELKGVYLQDITYTTLKELRIKFLTIHSPGTVRNTMETLHKILSAAHRDELILKNPFEHLERFQWVMKKRDAFSLDEVKMLYQKIFPRYKNMVMLLALTGMRVSEGIGVRQQDIKQLSDGTLYIDLREQVVQGKRTILKTKENRVVPIIPEIKELINDDDLINTPQFSKALKVVSLKFKRDDDVQLSIHSLRHFFITNAKSCGVNPLKVEKIAGHSLKGMEGTYTNFNVDDLKEILKWQEKTLSEVRG